MRSIVAACAAAIFAALVATSAAAQGAFPTRAMRFIVPFPGGGINDVLARIIGDKLQAKWGQPVVIENKTGAGGISVPISLTNPRPTATRCCSARRFRWQSTSSAAAR